MKEKFSASRTFGYPVYINQMYKLELRVASGKFKGISVFPVKQYRLALKPQR